jgi:hypothetical protein
VPKNNAGFSIHKSYAKTWLSMAQYRYDSNSCSQDKKTSLKSRSAVFWTVSFLDGRCRRL